LELLLLQLNLLLSQLRLCINELAILPSQVIEVGLVIDQAHANLGSRRRELNLVGLLDILSLLSQHIATRLHHILEGIRVADVSSWLRLAFTSLGLGIFNYAVDRVDTLSTSDRVVADSLRLNQLHSMEGLPCTRFRPDHPLQVGFPPVFIFLVVDYEFSYLFFLPVNIFVVANVN